MISFLRVAIFFIFLIGVSSQSFSVEGCSHDDKMKYSKKALWTYRELKNNLGNFNLKIIGQRLESLRSHLRNSCLHLKDIGSSEENLRKLLKESIISEIEIKSLYFDVSDEIKKFSSFLIPESLEKEEALIIKNRLEKIKVTSRDNALEEKVKCSPRLDLSNKFADIPLRNQEDKGWCFAYTVADMISVNIGENVSAIDIGFRYYDRFWNMLEEPSQGVQAFNSGPTLPLYKEIISGEICYEKDLPSSDLLFLPIGELMKEIQELKVNYDKYSSNFQANRHRSSRFQSKERSKEKALNEICPLWHIYNQLFPRLKINDFVDVLDHSTKWSFLKDLRDKSCKKKVNLKDKGLTYEASYESQSDPKSIYNSIDEWLKNGNITSIRYLASFLQNEGIYTENSSHFSSVIGFEYNEKDKSCNYIIRNSWGKNCSYYDKNSVNCDNKTGLISVSKYQLHKSIKSAWTAKKQ